MATSFKELLLNTAVQQNEPQLLVEASEYLEQFDGVLIEPDDIYISPTLVKLYWYVPEVAEISLIFTPDEYENVWQVLPESDDDKAYEFVINSNDCNYDELDVYLAEILTPSEDEDDYYESEEYLQGDDFDTYNYKDGEEVVNWGEAMFDEYFEEYEDEDEPVEFEDPWTPEFENLTQLLVEVLDSFGDGISDETYTLMETVETYLNRFDGVLEVPHCIDIVGEYNITVSWSDGEDVLVTLTIHDDVVVYSCEDSDSNEVFVLSLTEETPAELDNYLRYFIAPEEE
jgi:hypothetical protein